MRPDTVAERAEWCTTSDFTGAPAWYAVTVYSVIGEPPSSDGATHEIVADPLPAVADVIDGAPGGRRGVMAADGPDSALEPTTLVACTENE